MDGAGGCSLNGNTSTTTTSGQQPLTGIAVGPVVRSHEVAYFNGMYTIQAAALYLRATTPPRNQPLHIWEREPRPGYVRPSARSIAAWIRFGLDLEIVHVGPRTRTVTFQDLIRMRMVALLRTRGLSLHEILDAEAYARTLTGSHNPFVTEPLWTSGSDAFLKFRDKILSISRAGQYALEFLNEYLEPVHHGLQFGPEHYADIWRPYQAIAMDPTIAFGAPCIESTRIQTESIWSLHKAGDSPEYLSNAYGVDISRIRAALNWEQRLANAA